MQTFSWLHFLNTSHFICLVVNLEGFPPHFSTGQHHNSWVIRHNILRRNQWVWYFCYVSRTICRLPLESKLYFSACPSNDIQPLNVVCLDHQNQFFVLNLLLKMKELPIRLGRAKPSFVPLDRDGQYIEKTFTFLLNGCTSIVTSYILSSSSSWCLIFCLTKIVVPPLDCCLECVCMAWTITTRILALVDPVR